MPIADELLALLACPKCKGPLLYERAKDELQCQTCRLVYRIEDDVPVLLVEEAKPLS